MNDKLKGQFVRMYVSKKGNDTFVYRVSGSPEALKQFKADNGENARHEDNDPKKSLLFFTTRVGATSNVDLIRTQSGNWIIDNSVLRAKANLVSQFGGNLGVAMAQQIASEMSNVGTASTSSAPVAEETADLTNPK